MAFAFLQRGNLADSAKQMSLTTYVPEISVENLLTGVDNVRTDVYLSPRFCQVTRGHIFRLLGKYGAVEDFLVDDTLARVAAVTSVPARGTFIGQPTTPVAPKATTSPGIGNKTLPPIVEPQEFKKAWNDIHIASLNKAKADGNISLDLVSRLAVIKFIRAELNSQFNAIVERCRLKLKNYEGPRTINAHKAEEMRGRFSKFHVSKKTVIRKAGQDIFSTLREIEKETLGKMRRSMFGEEKSTMYELLLNRLLFTDDARDDYVNAEYYVMLGNYERDPDKFQTMLEYTTAFLKSLNLVPNDASDADKWLDQALNVPDNALELFNAGTPDENTERGKAQRALLTGWMDFLEKEGVLDYVLASYEAVPLLPQYSPPINPQQLKNALIDKAERKRVESLLEEGKIPVDGLNNAVKKLEGTKGNDKAKVAGRYFSDFIRFHRDLRRFEAVISAMDGVNVIATDKLRELSAINNTLYEFMLSEEQKQADATVVSHVILKADIRDSTSLTRTLYERGLNPASYFSLNFFDPVNKLLPKYDATKVFIEGDALILALFEREGEQSFAVGKTCMLAKEMIEIVRAYNAQSTQSGLPTLELGLGICYQESAPMYLMDGTHRIMISKALNESDRLSGCSKGAKKYIGGGSNDSLFNVYSFQTVDDADTGGMPDEFLVRYNIGGIHINALAFQKLQKEIALKEHTIELPMIWKTEKIKLYSGVVPVGQGIFHKIVVREGNIAHVDARDFSLRHWTEKKYYEVCVNETIYEYLASSFGSVN